MPLEIKVGHRYRTRSGDVVEIVSKDSHHVYPFLGIFTGKKMSRFFTGNGKWGISNRLHPFDLLEELPAHDEYGLTADDYYTGISYPNG